MPRKITNVLWRNGWPSFRVKVGGLSRWVAIGVQDESTVAEIARAWRQQVRLEKLRRRCESAGMPCPVKPDEAVLERLGLLRQRSRGATIPEVCAAFLADAAGRTIKPRSAAAAVSSLKLIVRTARGTAAEQGLAAQLDGDLLADYEAALVKAAKPEGAAALEAALTTATSTIAQAKSVFSAEAMRGAQMRALTLPDLTTFRAFKAQGTTRKIRVALDDVTLARLKAASDDLWFNSPERWLAFALCAGIGLRRGEAVRARWDWVRIEGGKPVMYLVTTADGTPKGNEHKKEIDASLWADMQAVRVAGCETIVPRATPKEREAVLKANIAWLRELGLDVDKPNHELRAAYLQALDRKHGREAAQLGGGHGDARTTEQYTSRGTAPAVRWS